MGFGWVQVRSPYYAALHTGYENVVQPRDDMFEFCRAGLPRHWQRE
jgi:hypothetical protein